MADSDDWRAERAAQLAGTPFARPSATSRLDDTLPIQTRSTPPLSKAAKTAPPVNRSAKVAPLPRTASASRSTRRTLTIAGLVAVVAAAVGLGELRQGTDSETFSPPVSSARVTEQARRVPAASIAAPIVAPSTSPTVASPAIDTAPRLSAERELASVQAVRAPHPSRSVKAANGSAPHHVTWKRRTSAHTRENTHPEVAKSSPAPLVGVMTTPPAQAVSKLPVCQPNVYNRPSRPCRPSHSRQVREPFYDN